MGPGSPEEFMTAAEQWVWLARIRRTQGRKGEVFADILTDFPEKFAERKRLWLLPATNQNASAAAGSTAHPAPREVDLIAHWPHKGGIVLHFAGVDSISAAEILAGLVVAIPWADRAILGENEAYIGDLIGCMLVDVSGTEPSNIGEIEDVDTAAGPTPLLVVIGARGEILIPFAKSYLQKLDVAGKRVEMALPEGLIDLNSHE